MAKQKKRTAAAKKSTKRGKASAQPARKKTAKRAMAKKPISKARRITKRVTKPSAKDVRPQEEVVAQKAASVESKTMRDEAAIETTA